MRTPQHLVKYLDLLVSLAPFPWLQQSALPLCYKMMQSCESCFRGQGFRDSRQTHDTSGPKTFQAATSGSFSISAPRYHCMDVVPCTCWPLLVSRNSSILMLRLCSFQETDVRNSPCLTICSVRVHSHVVYLTVFHKHSIKSNRAFSLATPVWIS